MGTKVHSAAAPAAAAPAATATIVESCESVNSQMQRAPNFCRQKLHTCLSDKRINVYHVTTLVTVNPTVETGV